MILRAFLLFFLCSSLAFTDGELKLKSEVEKLQGVQKDLYKNLANELRCPTCMGLSVEQSDTPFSNEIKKSLVEQIESGKSEKEILSFFKERFGLWILRTPPKEGFHWFAWYLPIGLILLGAFLVWSLFWRKKIVLQNVGMRTAEEILKEMDEKLERMRKAS